MDFFTPDEDFTVEEMVEIGEALQKGLELQWQVAENENYDRKEEE